MRLILLNRATALSPFCMGEMAVIINSPNQDNSYNLGIVLGLSYESSERLQC
jgi:hypothetical protein